MHAAGSLRPLRPVGPVGPLRVGTVPYLVGRPLDSGLEDEPGIELVRAVPSSLVLGLRSGALDVALVSSIELFRRPGYRYLSGLGVCGPGRVASVQVFLRKPIESVRTIALDPSSAAAAALVRVLLPDRELVVAEGDPSAAPADAWLEIGDPALRRTLTPDPSGAPPPTFNPSEAWRERTGLPFVFAVWIVRAGASLSPRHLEAFARARARGASRLPELAAQASREWSLPLEACRRYLAEECRYDAGEDLERSLFAFRDAAAKLGLCRADLAPQSIPITTAHVA